jgi:hypothetical protein
MRDVTISQADAPNAQAFDALMASLLPEDNLAIHYKGSFRTAGVYRWGQFAKRNVGKGWTIDGDAEISIDSPTQDNQPLFCLAGSAQSVKGITVRGNHSVLAKTWQGSLRTGGVLLDTKGTIDSVTFKDFGAKRAPNQPKSISSETFVAEAIGGGSILNCTFTEHDLASTDDQVSVWRSMAAENGEFMLEEPCLQEGNTTNAPGSKWVQAHCIYGLPGFVRKNKSIGGYAFYYGDFYKTKGVKINDNTADQCTYGVQLKLSPTAGDNTELPKYFSHEDYEIGLNRFGSSRAQVSINTYGPMTATRYIRGIRVHNALTLENFGGEVERFGEDLNARKGCSLIRRWF